MAFDIISGDYEASSMVATSILQSSPHIVCMKVLSSLDMAPKSRLSDRQCVADDDAASAISRAVEFVQKKTSMNGVTVKSLAIECQPTKVGQKLCKDLADQLCTQKIIPSCAPQVAQIGYNGEAVAGK